jgi:hypothetical protein
MSFFSPKKLALPASILLFSLGIINGVPSRAQISQPVCVEGSAENLAAEDDGCLKAAEKYELTIYEMGLCSSDPLILGSSGKRAFVKAACQTTFANDAGKIANIAGKRSVDLDTGIKGSRPRNNTYTHAYIILSNNITIQGKHAIGNTTYYSYNYNDNGLSTIDSSLYAQFTESITNISQSEEWEAYMPALDLPDGDKVTALLIGPGYSVTNSAAIEASSESAIDKLIAVFIPGGGVTIDDDALGLEVKLDSAKGMSVFYVSPEVEGNARLGFGSAPFKPTFNVIK